MFCKNCGNKLNEENMFCNICGTANDTVNKSVKPSVKKTRRKFIIVITIILIAALGIGGGYAYYKIRPLINNNTDNAVNNANSGIENAQNESSAESEKPSSKSEVKDENVSQSKKITDYVDGALLHIVVPPNKSIEIPNTSDGTLPIQWKGIANVMEITEDNKIQTREYNSSSTSGSISVKRHARVILQNSGSSDVTVSVSSNYTEYRETTSQVYDTISLNTGDSVSFAAKQRDTIYLDDNVYDYIEYKSDNMSLGNSGVKDSKTMNISQESTYVITATEPLKIHYCPSTTERIARDKSAFESKTVASGKTIRVYATDKSKNIIYANGCRCDYVTYGSDGTVKQQKQDVIVNNIPINKNCYVDFTNLSANEIQIKIPSLGFKIEER